MVKKMLVRTISLILLPLAFVCLFASNVNAQENSAKITFETEDVTVDIGQDVQVKVVYSGSFDSNGVSLQLSYNPEQLSVVSIKGESDTLSVGTTIENGVAGIDLAKAESFQDGDVLAVITVRLLTEKDTTLKLLSTSRIVGIEEQTPEQELGVKFAYPELFLATNEPTENDNNYEEFQPTIAIVLMVVGSIILSVALISLFIVSLKSKPNVSTKM